MTMLYNNHSLKQLENKPYKQYLDKYHRYLSQDHIELLKYYYYKRTGTHLDLDSPKSYTEKLQWLKMYWRDDLVYDCVDKIKAKEIVASLGCPEIVMESLCIFEKCNDIDFSRLPDKFVLKPNNSSGFNLFVSNKNDVDVYRTRDVFKKILNIKYYAAKLEWCYEKIHPRILCEPLFELSSNRPLDYKFYCFHGEVKFIEILNATDWYDNETIHTLMVDRNFRKLPFSLSTKSMEVSQSCDFEKMVKYAEILSSPFPHVRIDLYNPSNGVICFGEFTFFPEAGYCEFIPVEANMQIGQWLNLAKI